MRSIVDQNIVMRRIPYTLRRTVEWLQNWQLIGCTFFSGFARFLLPACIILQCSHIHRVVWRPHMQIAKLGAPWKYVSCLENLVLQELQNKEWDTYFILSCGTAASQNYGSWDGDGFWNVGVFKPVFLTFMYEWPCIFEEYMKGETN